MKQKLMITLSLILLFFTQITFAQTYRAYPYKGAVARAPVAKPMRVACNACGYEANNCGDSCSALEGCGWGGCQSLDGICGSCNCTDPNCGRNPCVSARKCCQVFGNVGAGDLGELSIGCDNCG